MGVVAAVVVDLLVVAVSTTIDVHYTHFDLFLAHRARLFPLNLTLIDWGLLNISLSKLKILLSRLVHPLFLTVPIV